jgi:DNA modification methylase
MYKIEEIKNKIICGDTLTELKKLPNECVDLVITSPPYYGLRKYGDYKEQIGLEETFNEYLEKILAITAEIKRILKPTGQFWLNLGDCYGGSGMGTSYDRQTCGPNSILKGKLDKFPKVGHSRGRMDKCLLMMPERIAIKMIDEQGWILRNKIKWAKQILHFKEKRTYGSVMPTSVKDRFNESGEELYFFVKSKKYYSDLDVVRLPPQSELNFERPRMGQGNQTIYEQKRAAGIVRQQNYPASKYNKFNYRVRDAKRKAGQPQFRASEEEIKRYQGKFAGVPNKINESLTNVVGKNLPTIWLIQIEPHNFQKELGMNTDHFAIFPQALCEIPIKFGCPKDGIVLDPFMGSGTTAIVAKKLNRNFIGIELNSDYIKIANERIKKVQPEII